MQKFNIWSRPELVIFSSLFWDEALFSAVGPQMSWGARGQAQTNMSPLPVRRTLPWQGPHLPNGRLLLGPNDLASISRRQPRRRDSQVFPPSKNGPMPVMYRTRLHRRNLDRWGGLAIFQMDQSSRIEASLRGVKLFTWGESGGLCTVSLVIVSVWRSRWLSRVVGHAVITTEINTLAKVSIRTSLASE